MNDLFAAKDLWNQWVGREVDLALAPFVERRKQWGCECCDAIMMPQEFDEFETFAIERNLNWTRFKSRNEVYGVGFIGPGWSVGLRVIHVVSSTDKWETIRV